MHLGRRLLPMLLCAAMFVTAVPFAHAENDDAPRNNQNSGEVVFPGKLFCSLVREVLLPYGGVVEDIKVNTGQMVEKDEVLLSLRLPRDTVRSLEDAIAPPDTGDWEYRLLDTKSQIEALTVSRSDTEKMVQQQMAPSRSLEQIDKQLDMLRRKQELLERQFALARKQAAEKLDAVRESLGDKTIRPGHVPEILNVRSPIAGHVLFINPELRLSADVDPKVVMLVGQMDPMIVSASVFERETAQLKVGDKMKFWLESNPGKVFPATVTRISWTPSSRRFDQPSYYEVELTAPNPDFFLKEGYKVLVSY